MNSVIMAVGLFIPSIFGVETDKDEVPELCSAIEDDNSEYIKIKDVATKVVPSKTVETCETILIEDKFDYMSNLIKDINNKKDSLEKRYEEETKELNNTINRQQEKINNYQEEIKKMKAEYERRLKEVKSSDNTSPINGSNSSNTSSNDRRLDKDKKEVVKSKSTGGKTFEATYYTAFCDTGCTGVTATGLDVSNSVTHNGHGVIAVDPSVIPLGSIVEINGRTYSAQDTGGNIKGNRVDILVASKSEASSKGRHNVNLRVLN